MPSSSSSRSLSSQSLSSWSTASGNSSSSKRSSSSSWSSESSAWDTGDAQAKSYLVSYEIKVRHNLFVATCSIDLRWRDAEVVEARGPLVIDIAGTFAGESHTVHGVPKYTSPKGRPGVTTTPTGSSSSASSVARPEPYPVQLIDGLKLRESWDTLESAEAWVSALEQRAQAAMAVLRQLYALYPNKYDQRTRTV